MKIAPYLANTVQRTYQRQQRVGERIAELKRTTAPGEPRPATEVNISPAASRASRASRGDLTRARERQLDDLSGRFVEKFLASLENPAQGAETEPEAADPGRPSFDRLLEGLDLAVRRDESGGEEGAAGGALVRKKTGEVILEVSGENRQKAIAELRALARDIFAELI